jgi:phosphinothricin acetyltransferase
LSELIFRTARPDDIDAITSIYAHHVLHGFGTFEEVPPSPDQMAQRMGAILKYGLPYMVAVRDGQVLAYAYASPFRLRGAYRYTVEDSIYVADGLAGAGIGTRLLEALVAAARACGFEQMVAVVGGAGPVSIALHTKCGFAHAGRLRNVGFKFGRRLDTVYMQCDLTEED